MQSARTSRTWERHGKALPHRRTRSYAGPARTNASRILSQREHAVRDRPSSDREPDAPGARRPTSGPQARADSYIFGAPGHVVASLFPNERRPNMGDRPKPPVPSRATEAVTPVPDLKPPRSASRPTTRGRDHRGGRFVEVLMAYLVLWLLRSQEAGLRATGAALAGAWALVLIARRTAAIRSKERPRPRRGGTVAS